MYCMVTVPSWMRMSMSFKSPCNTLNNSLQKKNSFKKYCNTPFFSLCYFLSPCAFLTVIQYFFLKFRHASYIKVNLAWGHCFKLICICNKFAPSFNTDCNFFCSFMVAMLYDDNNAIIIQIKSRNMRKQSYFTAIDSSYYNINLQ